MGRYKVKPTAKQVKALELIKSGKRPVPAMIEAGYSQETSQAPTRNLLSAAGFQTLLQNQLEAYESAGITTTFMASKFKEWLGAKKVKGSMTEPDKIVPDYETQLKAAEMIRKDWGFGQELKINQTNIGEMTLEFTGGEHSSSVMSDSQGSE